MRNKINVGGIIRRVFVVYADGASLVLPVTAVVFFIVLALDRLLRSAGRGYSLLTPFIGVVGSAIVSGIVVALVANIEDNGGDAGLRKLADSVRPVFGKLIIVGLVAALAEAIGFILLVVPGLYLLTIWSVYTPVIVLERPPDLDALGRSRDLVRGNGWRVFQVRLVFALLAGGLGIGFELARPSLGTLVLLAVHVVLATLAVPLSAFASAVLYCELRPTSE